MSVDALVIAAHPDDAEIAMGGTIAALTSSGRKVVLVDLTNGEPTPYGSPEQRAAESSRAAEILGVTERILLSQTNRELFDTIEARKELANVIRLHKPKLLFIPYWDDAHPDHLAAHSLSVAARFYGKFVKGDLLHTPHLPHKVFHYFSVHFRLKYTPTFLFDVSTQIDRKFAALQAYESQFIKHAVNRRFLDELRTENGYWGNRIGVAFAEPFLCKEHLAITADTLFSL